MRHHVRGRKRGHADKGQQDITDAKKRGRGPSSIGGQRKRGVNKKTAAAALLRRSNRQGVTFRRKKCNATRRDIDNPLTR